MAALRYVGKSFVPFSLGDGVAFASDDLGL